MAGPMSNLEPSQTMKQLLKIIEIINKLEMDPDPVNDSCFPNQEVDV